MDQRLIYFNGIDLDTASYRKPPIHLEEFTKKIARPKPIADGDLRALGDRVNPKVLSSAGWGVIFHSDEPVETRSSLGPLLEIRKAQAGDLYKELVYTPGETVDQFLDRYEAPLGDVIPKKVPYYLLIVGDPRKIPFQFQCDLDLVYGVGRLFFSEFFHYRKYAERLVQWEAAQGPFAQNRVAIFAPGNNEPLTDLSLSYLAKPLKSNLEQTFKETGQSWTVESIFGTKATKLALQNCLAPDRRPSLLFTANHGVAASIPENRERLQGGIVCADWQKPNSIQRSDCFCANDLSERTDLSGMISFQFSCFSGGTPQYDTGALPGVKPGQWHSHDFVAPLATKMLSLEKGCLAVIGHVDQAHQYSFLWHDRINDIWHFSDTIAKLSRGFPVAYAMEHINRRFGNVSARVLRDLTNPSDLKRPSLAIPLWLAYGDARNFTVLGDPSVRLWNQGAS